MLISKALKLRIETAVCCEHRLLLTQKEVTGNMKLADLTINCVPCANATLHPTQMEKSESPYQLK